MKNRAIIVVGYPASGKTTLINDLFAYENFSYKGNIILDIDYYTESGSSYEEAKILWNNAFSHALEIKSNMVIPCTGSSQNIFLTIDELIKNNYDIIVMYKNENRDICKYRNSLRTRVVPLEVFDRCDEHLFENLERLKSIAKSFYEIKIGDN